MNLIFLICLVIIILFLLNYFSCEPNYEGFTAKKSNSGTFNNSRKDIFNKAGTGMFNRPSNTNIPNKGGNNMVYRKSQSDYRTRSYTDKEKEEISKETIKNWEKNDDNKKKSESEEYNAKITEVTKSVGASLDQQINETTPDQLTNCINSLNKCKREYETIHQSTITDSKENDSYRKTIELLN